jgi:hypothetical protein
MDVRKQVAKQRYAALLLRPGGAREETGPELGRQDAFDAQVLSGE